MANFTVEKSHVIFKHLIHVGPEIDAEAVADFATRRNYSKQTRQVRTPKGVLQEYLFRPTTNPQSLIVFSRKGFVIDAKPSKEVLPLFRDAYDFYEKVMEDKAMTATVVLEINTQFEVFSPHSVSELIGTLYANGVNGIQMGKLELQPHGIILSAGSGRFPDKSIQFHVQPFNKDPERRMVVRVTYRSTELDDALKFVKRIDEEVVRILGQIAEKK